jgi:hypothetical protein
MVLKEEEISEIDSLRTEAKYLYYQLFQRVSSSQFLELYVKAHIESESLMDLPQSELAHVQTILQKKLDAVAIEPWLRKAMRLHALSSKLLLVSYLSECDSMNQEYSRQHPSGSLSILKIIILSLKSFFRLTRGFLQKHFYGIN